MNKKLKRFLAGVMLAGDLMMLPFFFIDGLSTGDGISWFLTAFFAIDAYLTIDYMKEMTDGLKEEEQEMQDTGYEYARNLTKAQYAYLKRKESDKEMAEEIRKKREVEEMDPEELHDLLSGETVSTFEHEEKRADQQ